MLKKIVIITSVLAASSTMAFANVAASSVGTPYVGLGLGVDNTLTNTNDNFGNHIEGFGARGALIDAFAGYGAMVNHDVYLGGEVFVNDTNSSVKLTDNDNDVLKMKTKYSYGASIIPGVMITDKTMGYVRLGLVRTRFEYSATGTDTVKHSATGGQLGLGMQTQLTQNVDLRGEYTYNGYRSFNVEGSSFKPSSDQFTVGVVYKFE